MTLYFPAWLAYVVVSVFGLLVAMLGLYILGRVWFSFIDFMAKQFKVSRALILFIRHTEYRKQYGEVADYKQKYKDLLLKTSPASGEPQYSDQEIQAFLDAQKAQEAKS